MDLANTMTVYNSSFTPEEADRASIAMDWAAVGRDIRVAKKNGDPVRANPAETEGLPLCP